MKDQIYLFEEVSSSEDKKKINTFSYLYAESVTSARESDVDRKHRRLFDLNKRISTFVYHIDRYLGNDTNQN